MGRAAVSGSEEPRSLCHGPGRTPMRPRPCGATPGPRARLSGPPREVTPAPVLLDPVRRMPRVTVLHAVSERQPVPAGKAPQD